METIKIKSGEEVTLTVNISSDANVGSNVSLDDEVIEESPSNNFSVALGNIDDLHGKILAEQSNFTVPGGNIDDIMNTTHVDIIVESQTTSETRTAAKNKLSASLFVAYIVLRLEKV